jgi:uncharacterized membrane protein (UPF0136 family)
MSLHLVLWVYIGLLVAGGLMGYLKAKSLISLVMSSAFALALAVCALGFVPQRAVPDALMLALLVVFVMRLVKTRKFMPAGLMLLLTATALVVILVQPS